MNSEYYKLIESMGHVLRRDEHGNIDFFAMDYGYHNGPACTKCHETWREHCQDKVEKCDGGV